MQFFVPLETVLCHAGDKQWDAKLKSSLLVANLLSFLAIQVSETVKILDETAVRVLA
jgi:hypothetical protein